MGNDWLSGEQRRLLDQLLDDEGVGRQEARIAARPAGRSELPLSYAQQRMWFFHRLQPASTMYNIVGAATLRGRVDRTAMQATVDALVRRHEVLRSTFHLGEDGEPVQRVNPPAAVPMPAEDLRHLTREAREEAVREWYRKESDRPFDLSRDLLLRPVLLRVADEEHLLLLSQHHIATDGWSLGILLKELSTLYEGYAAGRQPALADPEIHYGDFAVWQQEQQPDDVLADDLAYWRERLTGAHALELPTGRLRPPDRTWAGDALDVRMPAALTGRLKALGESERATLFMVLLAGVSTVLSRWSGQQDIVMGVPVANRNRTETEAVVGSFVNTLPLRIDLTGEVTFREFLRRVRQEAVDGYAHQDVPFEKIIEEINPEREASAHTPLIRHMLGLHNTPWHELDVPGLRIDLAPVNTGKARFDLEFELTESDDGGIDGKLWFAADIQDTPTVRGLLEAVYTLLEAAVTDPDTPLWRLPLLPADRTGAEAERAAGAPSGAPETVFDLLPAGPEDEAHESSTPVVTSAGKHLTRQDLAERVDGLARSLSTEHGVAAHDVVGVRLPPSAEAPVALLAVLAAGAVALPLDPSLTRADLTRIARQCRPSVVLTSGEPAGDDRLEAFEEAVTVLVPQAGAEGAASAGASPAAGDSPPRPGPEDRALLVPSRGGALSAHTHAQLAARLRHLVEAFPLERDRTVAVHGPLTADMTVSALLWPLVAGGCLHLAPAGPPAGSVTLPEAVLTVPSRIPALLAGAASAPPPDGGAAGPRWVLCTGEQLWPDTVEAFGRALPDSELVNLYSLAEAGPVAAHRVRSTGPHDFASGRVPVGEALGGSRLRVLDEHRLPVPAGVAGDLYVAGPPPAQGDPGSSPQTEDTFRFTGDRARWVRPGTLEILGRPAGLTVVQGRPLELGDVAAELVAHPVVSRAHLSVTDAGELVAHTVPEEDPPPPPEQWRDRFAQAYLGRDPESDPVLGTSGWRSPRSGEELTAEAMREWTDAAVRHVLDSRPREVLEIGCRNGLLLFRLAPRCDAYRATELSARARKHIGEQRDRLAGKADVVEVLDRAPDDFTGLDDDAFDTVVVNSLVTYCPDAGYLEAILEQAVRVVRPGGTVFVGDVPERAVQEAIHLASEAGRLAPDAPVSQLRQAVARRAAVTGGFALDPAFFHAVARRLPQVAEVAVLRRVTGHPSELTSLRYDVVLHVGSADSPAAPLTAETLDWTDGRLTAEEFGARLSAGEAPDELVLSRVPCGHLTGTARALEMLHDGSVSTAGELAGFLRDQPSAGSPAELLALLASAHTAGYEAVTGPCGPRFDEVAVALRRRGEDAGRTGPLARLLAAVQRPSGLGAAERRTQDLTFAAWSRSMPALLRGYLRDRLPLHAVPATVEPLTSWPVRPDGGLDAAAFPPPDEPDQEEERAAEAQTPTQKTVQKIWADILGVDHLGIHDDFFALGGHSLMGAAVIDRLREEFTLDLPLGQLFQTPTVAEVAEFIDQQESGAVAEPAPAIRRIDRSAYRRKRPGAGGVTSPDPGEDGLIENGPIEDGAEAGRRP